METISPFMRGMITRNSNGSITAPKNVLKTLSAAYQQYTSVRQEHIPRIAVYAAVEGMIAGNPPYDQEELERNGLGHIANFNNYKARSSYEKCAGGYWNLINSTEVFLKIILAGNVPKVQEFADIMAKHFSDVVKMWPDFKPNFNLLGSQLTKFGICPVIFPHEDGPFWEAVDVSRFYIPSETQVFLSKLTNVAVDTTYTVQQLYQIYENADEDDNWNRDALADFLIFRANAFNQTTTPYANFMDLQRFINTNNGLVSQYFTDTVRITNMYQKEYDEKFSHYAFSPEWFATTATSNITNDKDFMYFFDRQYDCIDEFLGLFTASPGEWNIYSSLGPGQKMFALSQAVNMLDCSVFDMSRMSSTILLRSLGTGGRDVAPLRFYHGVATDIGASEFVPNSLGANINQVVAASQYLTDALQRNTINSGDDPSVPDPSQGSIAPSSERSKSFKEFGVLKNVVHHFYDGFDGILITMFKRFLTVKTGVPGYKYAKEWKERCLDDGVPEELFDTARKGLNGLPRQFREVKASRVAGDGSTLARIMGLEALTPIAESFNPVEMAAYKREWVAATLGRDYIPTFASSDDQGDELSGGASLARLEDNFMKIGQEPLFSVDNDQEAHTDEHMGTASGVIQAVAQQQMSPVDADKIMAISIPHISQHIEYMSKVPLFYRDILAKVEKPFAQIRQWAQLNRRNAEAMIEAAIKKQQEDQAATEAVMSDAERKDFVAQRDVERADIKVEAQNTRADEANKTRADIMRRKTESDAEVKRLKVQLEADARQNATPKGRTQTQLASETPEQLSSRLSSQLGRTPSTVDFEPPVQ